MKQCQCNVLPSILMDPPAREYAYGKLKKIGEDPIKWQIFYVCPVCETHWLMEFPSSELQGLGPAILKKNEDMYCQFREASTEGKCPFKIGDLVCFTPLERTLV